MDLFLGVDKGIGPLSACRPRPCKMWVFALATGMPPPRAIRGHHESALGVTLL